MSNQLIYSMIHTGKKMQKSEQKFENEKKIGGVQQTDSQYQIRYSFCSSFY